MPEWNILISDGLDENGKAILRSACRVDDHSGIQAGELILIAGDYDALIVRSRTRVSAELLNSSPRLKVIGRAGIGVDNIDLAAAAIRRVIVVNAPLSTVTAVAEHTLALMFALARSLPQADAGLKNGQWLKPQLTGIELAGKILGIVGVGRIGSEVARRASALDMDVRGYDPWLTPEAIRQNGAEPTPLNDLLAKADFISVHVPFSPETRNLFNGQIFGMMKRGTRFICTARGGLVDETALLGALETGQLAGAALDVFSSEPPGPTALVSHPKVIATPHIAAQTREAQARAAIDIANEVLAALEGKPLRWKVV